MFLTSSKIFEGSPVGCFNGSNHRRKTGKYFFGSALREKFWKIS
jgi:hypothetical protein